MSERSDFSKFELQVANFCNLQFFVNKFVCTVLTDLLPRFCWKNDNYKCTFNDDACLKELTFLNITIGSCKFVQLAVFCK